MKGHSLVRLAALVTLLVLVLPAEEVFCRILKEKHRRKLPKVVGGGGGGENKNLCSIEGNSVPFHCFCSDGSLTTNATKAKCWVFNGLTQEHNFWSLFATQPLLTDLNVLVTQVGKLGFIPTKGLQYLKDLQSISIVYGSIDEIHPYAFANLSRLYKIELTRNRIVSLNHHAFAHLINLTELNLDENKISELNREVFIDLPNLKTLYLKQNNLSFIQENAFRHLGHLVELELSTNSLSVLTKDTFAGLGELKRLILSFNKIIMLGDLTFAELWVLEELDLEANQIEFISDRAFAGLTHLWRLNLSYNKLKNLGNTFLDGVPAIINFDLRHNSLETLTFDNVKPILHNFYNNSGYFYLADNNFVCDCRLAWMHILRNETRNQVIRDVLNDLTCHLEVDDDQVPVAPLFLTKKDAENTLLDEEDPSLNPLSAAGGNGGGVGVGGDSEYAYYEDDDDYQQQQSLQNQVTISQPEDPTLRHLFQIPLAELPCVQESKAPTQTPRHLVNTPAVAQINSRCPSRLHYSYSLLLVLFSLVSMIARLAT